MSHTRIDEHRIASALLVLLFWTPACQKERPAPPVQRSTEERPAAADTASVPELTGIWTVIGHHIPGVSAMRNAEAMKWRGRTVRLTEKYATSGESHCDAPSYVAHSASRDRFLTAEYHLPPGALGILASQEQVSVLDVSCRGTSWNAMGGRLIGVDANRVLAPWDGVFFELTRDHDVHALGSEPMFALTIRKGREISFAHHLGMVTLPTPVPQIDSLTGATIYHAVTEANDLRVVIEPTPCLISRDGRLFEATATVTFNGTTYHGCGETIP